MQLNDFRFSRCEYWFYFKGLWRERGLKATYKQFQKHLRRPYSRAIVQRYSSYPNGKGLEIGVGARTIAPVSRTLLADGYESHGKDRSIAQVYFPANDIPFGDATFDFVLSEHTLEHIGNALRALREWVRVLKPGGIPDHYLHVAKADLARTGSIHHHVWVAEDIKEVLQYLGLEAVCCENEVADRSDSFVVVGQKNN